MIYKRINSTVCVFYLLKEMSEGNVKKKKKLIKTDELKHFFFKSYNNWNNF